jgi:hypothetical protein
VELTVSDKATQDATITSADFFFDPEGDGSYAQFRSTDPVVTVAPGRTGHAAVDLLKATGRNGAAGPSR